MERKETPRWVVNASDKFYNSKEVRPYDKIIFLKGKNHIYKVWFQTIAQGQIETHYYKKLRTR
ncbi:MAG: hypothetical protein AABX28_00120 [Nanoarchaeota archaeon]